MNVVLYSTNCPKCKVLEAKLKQNNVAYEINNDVKLMESKGFTTAPKLEVDDNIMDFKQAVEWIGGLK